MSQKKEFLIELIFDKNTSKNSKMSFEYAYLNASFSHFKDVYAYLKKSKEIEKFEI